MTANLNVPLMAPDGPPNSNDQSPQLLPHGTDLISTPVPFRLLSLPPELTLHTASFLPPRSLFALLLTSRAFAHLSSLINVLSRQDYTVTEHGFPHVYTPLQFFSSRGIESIVRRLLLEGADPNDVYHGCPKYQLSPLTHAVGFCSTSIVALLLQHGANLNERNYHGHGYSPLDVAVSEPHQIHPQPPLHDRTGYIRRAPEMPQIVQLLIAAGSDVATAHPRRGTPLHMACAARNANPRIVAALIAAGADVRSRFDDKRPRDSGVEAGIQPIHYAASAGNVECVRLLLDAGADIEAATRIGIRPLDNAVLTMREDVLVMLLAAGADGGTSAPVESLAGEGCCGEVRGLVVDNAAVLGVADPWRLVRRRVEWAELAQWLLLRGCPASWESMAPWGMPVDRDARYFRNQCYPFSRRTGFDNIR